MVEGRMYEPVRAAWRWEQLTNVDSLRGTLDLIMKGPLLITYY
jgi:hypothetical protein